MVLAVLEEVDEEVDRSINDGEEVGQMGGVLHPGGPHQVLLKLKIKTVIAFMS